MRDVVLAHGLWVPGAAMSLLALRLARAGYSPHVFAYMGRHPYEANVGHFGRWAKEKLAGRGAHYVGHSLGGVLVLDMLNAHRDIPVGASVLLGAPVRGCLAGRKLAAAGVGRWMLGGCGVLWQPREARWMRDAPLGIIAGTLPLGLGRVLGRLPEANDGVVCVSETSVEGMTERWLVACGHSMLIASGAVSRRVLRFLGSETFE